MRDSMVEGVDSWHWARGIDLRCGGMGKHNSTGANRDEGQPWSHNAVANGTTGVICSPTGNGSAGLQACEQGYFVGDCAADSIGSNDWRQERGIKFNCL